MQVIYALPYTVLPVPGSLYVYSDVGHAVWNIQGTRSTPGKAQGAMSNQGCSKQHVPHHSIQFFCYAGTYISVLVFLVFLSDI